MPFNTGKASSNKNMFPALSCSSDYKQTDKYEQ